MAAGGHGPLECAKQVERWRAHANSDDQIRDAHPPFDAVAKGERGELIAARSL